MRKVNISVTHRLHNLVAKTPTKVHGSVGQQIGLGSANPIWVPEDDTISQLGG